MSCFNFKGFSGQQTPLIFETNEVTVETLSLARTQEDQHECAAAQIDLKKKRGRKSHFQRLFKHYSMMHLGVYCLKITCWEYQQTRPDVAVRSL